MGEAAVGTPCPWSTHAAGKTFAGGLGRCRSRMSAVPDDEWLPALEVARRLGIPPPTLYHQAQRGQLEARKEGRRLFVKMPPPAPPKPPPKTPRPPPPPPPPDPSLLDVPTVARLLGVTGSFVLSLVASGQLRAQRRGRFSFVHPDDVQSYLEAARIVPGTMGRKGEQTKDVNQTPRRRPTGANRT